MTSVRIGLFLSVWLLLAVGLNTVSVDAHPAELYNESETSVFASAANAQTTPTFELGGQIFTFITAAEMQSAGMTWVKYQLTYRTHDLGNAQFVIDHGRRHGFKVLLSIKGRKSDLNSGNASQYYRDYASFVGQVAALGPNAIEVWNEPNIDAEWPAGMISGTEYARLLARAYPAIKSANANVMVISGAPSPTGFFGGCRTNGCDDNVFIDQMESAGAASNFDCTGIHYNEGVLPPSASSGDPRSHHYTRYYSTMVSTYRNVFPTKPLCFTEIGYLTPEGLGSLPSGYQWGANTSIQEQADWLGQAATLSRNGGVVRLMIVWNVDSTLYSSDPMAGWAIIRNGNCRACTTLRAAMNAVQTPTSAPTLNAPANFALITTTTPPFSWSSVSQATQYRLQVDNNSDFSSPEYSVLVTTTSSTPTTPLAEGTYYWRVRGGNTAGGGPWSAVRQLVIETNPLPTPTLTAPTQNYATPLDRPTFTWSSVSGATQYELRLGTSNPPTTAVYTGAAATYTPASALAVGTYYWQVRALDGTGNSSAWTTPFTLTILALADAAPSLNFSTSRTVTLTWNPVTWAATYEVQVDTDTLFESPLAHSVTVNAPALSTTTPSLADGTYYWRVRAKAADTTAGDWSLVESFTVDG